MLLYTAISYLAISIHMTMIREFGGIATVLIGNARKALTIVLSFLLFPKPGSIFYLLGGTLVFGGLTLNAVSKERGWWRARGDREKQRPSPASTASLESTGQGQHAYTELPTRPPPSDDHLVDPCEDDREAGHQRT
jgi:hypothetical protein